MCTCHTKSGPRGANAVGEEHLQTWQVQNVYSLVSCPDHTFRERCGPGTRRLPTYCWGKNSGLNLRVNSSVPGSHLL